MPSCDYGSSVAYGFVLEPHETKNPCAHYLDITNLARVAFATRVLSRSKMVTYKQKLHAIDWSSCDVHGRRYASKSRSYIIGVLRYEFTH